MNCSKSTTGGELYPIEEIASFMPEAIAESIDIFNSIPCRLSKDSYCTQNKCHFNQTPPSSIPMSCTCSMYTLLGNMYTGMYKSTYCVITNQTNVMYSMNNQEVRINIIQDNGNSIENVTINIDQIMSVRIASLTSTSVQMNIAELCNEVIDFNILSSEENPDYFNDEVSKGITKSFQEYNGSQLKDIVQVNVKQTIQSMTSVDQVITITIRNSTWQSLQFNINQQNIVEIIAQNIAKVSLSNITKEVLKSNIQNLEYVIRDNYCKKKSSNYYYILLIYLLLIPFLFLKMNLK